MIFDTGSEFLTITSTLCRGSDIGCQSQSYDMNDSLTQMSVSDYESVITYGSAELTGQLWNDLICFEKAPNG